MSFFNCKSQIVYHQDVFYGGVTGDGFNPHSAESTGYFNLFFEPGSVVRKAFLFISVSTKDSVVDNTLTFNGAEIPLSASFTFSNNYMLISSANTSVYFKTLIIDVTQLINTSNNSYSLTSPNNQNPLGFSGIYSDYYLYVEYENPALTIISTSVILNNQDADGVVNYDINLLNKIDLNKEIGFTFNSQAFCDTVVGIEDGSYVFVNNNLLGLLGGQESSNEPLCTGVRGAFYYQNSTLFGLGNDIANNTMSGTDALAEISSYVSNSDSINVRFEYQNIGEVGEKSNPINQLFLAYTTPCDTFSVSVPNDTIVCRGTQLQLNVTGGQSYEWLPATGLSCDTCANPIFTADSSMNYTVRIWNNDSCSVVRPLQILVSQPKIDTLIISPPTCGTNDGEIAVNASSFSWLDLSYSSGGVFQTDSVLSNLAESNLTLTVQDEAGCSVDTTFFLPSVNNTNALFTVNPPGGEDVPMVIWANSTSQNANQFEWWIDSVLVGNNNEQYHTFNTSGAHEIMLVAWQYDPNCADTSIFEFNIKRKVIIPTAFTPDGDGINDFWEILYLDELYPQNKVFVYNRWGNLVYESEEGKYGERAWAGASTSSASGTTGSSGGGKLPVGSYFYVIKTGTNDADFTGSVTIVR